MDPEYEKAVKTRTSAGRLPIQIAVSPVTAARAGGLPGMSRITGYLQQQNIDTETANRLRIDGLYYGNVANEPLNRMNLSTFSAATRTAVPHERRHAVQTGGVRVNTALKAAAVPGTPTNERLKTYQGNPSEENKEQFLDSLNLSSGQTPTTKAFSKFVSTVTGYRHGPETAHHITRIMTLPSQTNEFDKNYPTYSFDPAEVDARVQDDIHTIVTDTPTDASQFAETFGTDHLHHIEQFNKTGDVAHLKNFETHVRNTAISHAMRNSRNNQYLNQAERYFDGLQDHISSGEMTRTMSTPPADVEGWKKNSLKALNTFRQQHRQHVQRVNRDAMGAAALILTHGTNLGGNLLQQYQGDIVPEHQQRFQQHLDQSFASMDPKLNLHKEPATPNK
jgi:hypothetical protein